MGEDGKRCTKGRISGSAFNKLLQALLPKRPRKWRFFLCTVCFGSQGARSRADLTWPCSRQGSGRGFVAARTRRKTFSKCFPAPAPCFSRLPFLSAMFLSWWFALPCPRTPRPLTPPTPPFFAPVSQRHSHQSEPHPSPPPPLSLSMNSDPLSTRAGARTNASARSLARARTHTQLCRQLARARARARAHTHTHTHTQLCRQLALREPALAGSA